MCQRDTKLQEEIFGRRLRTFGGDKRTVFKSRSELKAWQVDFYFQALKRRNFRDLTEPEKEIQIQKPLQPIGENLKTKRKMVMESDEESSSEEETQIIFDPKPFSRKRKRDRSSRLVDY